MADIVDDTLTTTEDSAVTMNLITGTGGADNFENTGRTLTAVTQGAHGAVTFLADGNVTYTPTANWSGTDTFTYTVTSGGVTETATATVVVTPINHAPVVTNTAIVSSNPLYSTMSDDWTNPHFIGNDYKATSTYGGTTATVVSSDGTNHLWAATDPWGIPAGQTNGSVFIRPTGYYTWNFTGSDVNSLRVYIWNLTTLTTTGQTNEAVEIYVNGSLVTLSSANLIANTYTEGDISVNATTNRLEYGVLDTAGGAGIYLVSSATPITSISVRNAGTSLSGSFGVALAQAGTTTTQGNGAALSTLAPATDIDAGSSIRGYAITGGAAEAATADATPGKWQYYNGTAWVDITGTLSTTSALFLTADSFGVWQDANGDGKVEGGEFKTLAEAGISSINLTSNGVQKSASTDVLEYGRSTATTTDGEKLAVVDAAFSYDTADSALQNAKTTLLGAGSHVQGGTGVDVFAWGLAEPASSVLPTATIDRFEMTVTAGGGDVLNLRDLLSGESHQGTDVGNLADYLHFAVTDGNTTIAIKSAGSAVTQNVLLNGVDLGTLGNSDTAIIHELLVRGKLLTD